MNLFCGRMIFGLRGASWENLFRVFDRFGLGFIPVFVSFRSVGLPAVALSRPQLHFVLSLAPSLALSRPQPRSVLSLVPSLALFRPQPCPDLRLAPVSLLSLSSHSAPLARPPPGLICGPLWLRCTPWRGEPSSSAPWESTSRLSCRFRRSCSRCARAPFRGCG